ncbi:MAG TPA: hypothetical protein VFS43_14225 [Polyangiaceae bacterium]|nr:hypothetical protein [Polyangiaceae bacterium]
MTASQKTRRRRAALAFLFAPAALVAARAWGQAPPPPPPEGAAAFSTEAGGRAVFFPPAEGSAGEKPLTMMLHGMCATPEWECPFFRKGAAASGYLLCGAGPALCGGGPGSRWSGAPGALAKAVNASVEGLERRLPAGSKLGPGRALVGYSLGAAAASKVIELARPGEWSGLVVVNASAVPSAAQLRKAGVKRVALVAGERDMTAPKLKRAAKALEGAGLEARYFSLGPVGHYFGETTEAALEAPLRWVHGRE